MLAALLFGPVSNSALSGLESEWLFVFADALLHHSADNDHIQAALTDFSPELGVCCYPLSSYLLIS